MQRRDTCQEQSAQCFFFAGVASVAHNDMITNFLYEFDRCMERELKEVILLHGVPRASRFSKSKDYSGENLLFFSMDTLYSYDCCDGF